MRELIRHTDHVNELLARYGVKFGIYKNNVFKEQLFPFDAIPRVIEHDEFERLEGGLKQRVKALNLFLKDIWPEHTASKLKRISIVTGIHGDQLVDGIFNLMKKMGIWLSECAFQRYFSSTGEALGRTEKRRHHWKNRRSSKGNRAR